MSGLWDDPAIPKKDWVFTGLDDMGEPAFVCNMCRAKLIRYVHYLRHRRYPAVLGVGCICASKLEADSTWAELREREHRTLAARRAKFAMRQWPLSGKGNPTTRQRGVRVTVFPVPGPSMSAAPRWKFIVGDEFSDRTYASMVEAKAGAYDALMRVLNALDRIA
jgi:hypothetical protein